MPTPTTYSGFVTHIIDILNLLIPLLFGCVFIFFMWKIIDSWIINAGDEKKVTEGKDYLMAAILVIIIMLSAWGIVAMIKETLFP